MTKGRWSVMLLAGLWGCASGPSWVAQPSHAPMVGLDSIAETPAPVDVIQTLMESSTRGVTAQVKGTVVGATLVYPKSLAATYAIATKVHRTTTVIFPMGERLSGDITGGKEQVRYQPYPDAEAQSAQAWVISPGYSGDGEAKHLQVDITPIAANLQTTIVVRTTGGWYVLDVTSKGKGYYPMVAFWQPEAPTPRGQTRSTPVATGPLGMGYQILVADGQAPAWTPVAVWDTQALTVFQFSQALAQGEAPELYSVTPEGDALVNTTPQGQWLLIAHRLSGTWELKLGSAVVRVQQTPDYMVVTCPGQPGCPTTMAPQAAR